MIKLICIFIKLINRSKLKIFIINSNVRSISLNFFLLLLLYCKCIEVSFPLMEHVKIVEGKSKNVEYSDHILNKKVKMKSKI
jgi:hypothetical protein